MPTGLRNSIVGVVALGSCLTGLTPSSTATATGPALPAVTDWPGYGHDAQHSFHGQTSLTIAQARTLKQAWFFPTGDAVTATPTVVGGTVYVGSWDGYFYAVDLVTGALRWKYQLSPQPAVTPYPGQNPRNSSSDGGLVTSSAWYEQQDSTHPNLVIFGGGYTLYALDADTGSLFWSHEYTGRPELPADPVHDGTRIFSSPVVYNGAVFFAADVDGVAGYRGYVVAASVHTGAPLWTLQTDVDATGQILNDGCGNAWSSGTLLPGQGLVVFTMADCQGTNAARFSESVVALRIADGTVAWMFKPKGPNNCDADFGATANAALDPAGNTTFLGVGAKNGTYYSLTPGRGTMRWRTNVVFGGQAGGFIGTTAFDGTRVYGSTALGDFGGPLCNPHNPRYTALQEPTVHAFDAARGTVIWQQRKAPSFGPTTVAGGMTFAGVALSLVVQVRNATTGAVIAQLQLAAPCWSGLATVGDAVVLGTGTSYQGSPDGIVAFTPAGLPPAWESREGRDRGRARGPGLHHNTAK
jgi:outer membrane protein assembly factor BamB